jgi:glucuronoarabinoxylan endo-1,4-beta-xylanase
MTNFVKSLQSQAGVNLYAISIQNEPDQCQGYDSALWSASQIDTFISANLGPTFASNGISTLIFMPEGGNYTNTLNLGGTCGTDSACTNYVSGYNWHDYGAVLSGTNSVTANPYPSTWASGKKYWETEASCILGASNPTFCQSGFNTDITDALQWAAVIDQRIAVDGANAWLYWWMVGDASDDEGLTNGSGAVAQRAYMLGQYAKFVRPGYYRIDATHNPVSGVSVSTYQNRTTNTLVIVATNYTGSEVSQQFNIINAPTFSNVTPTITSANLSLATQSSVAVSSNSFTYTLPADSITTFVCSGP